MMRLKTAAYLPGLLLVLIGCSRTLTAQLSTLSDSSDSVVRLYPGNPRYIEYQGKPTILVTSAEHYGAMVNLDFDFRTYLETLGKEGFNYTRIFTGTYIEPTDNYFGIQRNTLAPLPGNFISPWAMAEGKYDLEKFNPLYFNRLKEFIQVAESSGIVVELTLFSSIYGEKAWERSPFHINNNINRVGDLPYRRVNTLYNGDLSQVQERYIRKMVRELNSYDNVFFEIQNEPWADNNNLAGYVNENDDEVYSQSWQKNVELANQVSIEWQEWVVSIIRKEEASLPKTHLIAQNICNFKYKLDHLPKGISIINFHYALPGAVHMNLGLGAVVGLDETGFMPHEDHYYIKQAWRVILSGGGLYNNLDYSFTAGTETGLWPIPDGNPGWGGPQFREKLSILVETMKKVPFAEMEVTSSLLKETAPGMKQYGLQKKGEIYLVFVEELIHAELIPLVPTARYEATFIDMESGETKTELVTLGNGTSIESPFEKQRAVLMLKKSQ